MRNGDPALRVNGLAGAMTSYLSDHFDLPPGQLTPNEVRALLHANSTDAELADEICTFLEACDAARYAPSNLGDVSAAETTARIRGWIRRIERTTR